MPFNKRTYEEFMSITESTLSKNPTSKSDIELAKSGILTKRADDLQREIDAVTSGKPAKTPNRSARKVTKQSYDVKEESGIDEKFTLAADKSKPQSPKPTFSPKSRERNIGKHNDWNDKPTEWGEKPPAAKKLASRANAVTQTQRRQDRETGVTNEAKVDAGLSDTEKKEVRTARSGLTGQNANYERRGAHREKDERNKDLADLRKGKKKNSSYFSYLP